MPSLIEGLIAGYGIAIPVGAVAILIINVGMRCGFRTGFMAGAGAATADLLYAALAAAAGAALASVLESIASELRIVSALVLIGLAILGLRRGLRASDSSRKTAHCSPLRAYGQFVAITIANPLTIVYFAAFMLGRSTVAAMTFFDHAAFVAGVGLASLSWQTVLAGLGSIAHRHLPTRFRLLAVIGGNLLVLALGLQILIKAFL